MGLDRCPYRRQAAILLMLVLFVTCTAAEEGVLVLIVTDTGQHPFANVQIGAAGDGGPPQPTDAHGKARLKLAPNTKPNTWVTLLLGDAPGGLDLVFISPYDGRVRVPPYDNEQDNYDPVVLTKRSDKAMLESGSAMLAVHANVSHAITAEKKKAPAHSSRNRQNYLHPSVPRFQTVAFNAGSAAPNQSDSSPSPEELQQVALEATATKFGLSVADLKAAIASWGGDALLWKSILLTATIENGGSDPFPAIHVVSGNLFFGIGTWSFRDCTLQPVLLKFQQSNEKRFAEIVGPDTEWLSKTLRASCQVSSKAALERMLEDAGRLKPEWRDRLRSLGNEHEFQRIQVAHLMSLMRSAQSAASSFGLQSEQAVAFAFDFAEVHGLRELNWQLENFSQDVPAFKQLMGRDPDEQEKLLMLANRVIQSAKSGKLPQSTPSSMARATLLSQGQGDVFGTHYDLQDFGIGMQDVRTGVDLPLHNDPAILEQLQKGWTPADGPIPEMRLAEIPSAPAQGEKPPPPVLGGKPTPLSSAQANYMPEQTPPPETQTGRNAPGERKLVELINQERTSRGLQPLVVDHRLSQSACKHTEQMVKHKATEHQFDGEPAPPVRFAEENLNFGTEGENITAAKNVSTAHDILMHSPPHRDNILNPKFTAVGACALPAGGGVYVTEDFAHRFPDYSEAQADAVLQDTITKYMTGAGLPAPVRKPQPQLHQLACNMAQNDALDEESLRRILNVQEVVVWAVGDPAWLPPETQKALSQPAPSGYSLAACYARTPTRPGGVYWTAMVIY